MQDERSRPRSTELTGYLRQMPALLLLDRLPTPILGLSTLGDVAYANLAYAKMLGYSAAAAVTRLHLPQLLAGHHDSEPGDCVATLRTAKTAVGWNHAHDYVIRTMVSPPLLVRDSDPLLLLHITDVTEWLWESKPASALRKRRGRSP